MAKCNVNAMETQAIIKETPDSYALIHKTRQQARTSKHARHKLFYRTILAAIGLLVFAIAILYIFASKTIIACQQTLKANSDWHTPDIVSCEVTRQFLVKPNTVIVPLTPTQSFELNRSSDGDTCNVKLNTINNGDISLTSYTSSTQCGLNSEVAALNHFIVAPQQTESSELSYTSLDSNGTVIAGFSYGVYWIPVAISLFSFALFCGCIFTIIILGLLRGIKFDKRAKTVTFYYVTWFTAYKVSYPFNDIMDVYIKLIEDNDTNEIKVRTHYIKTTDGKSHYIDIRMPLLQEKQVHNAIRRILDLPVNNETHLT